MDERRTTKEVSDWRQVENEHRNDRKDDWTSQKIIFFVSWEKSGEGYVMKGWSVGKSLQT